MGLTAKYVDEKLEEKYDQLYEEGYDGSGFWLDAYYEETIDEEFDVPGLPKITFVDSGGGEGDGAEIYVVVQIGDQYFQKTGYYSSWGESEMDGATEEVQPKKVVRTEWETV